MLTPAQILKANPGLQPFIVSLHEEKGDKFKIHFECYAEDSGHADDQAQDAYPEGEILTVTQVRAEDLVTAAG
jgi:hypothetical protein